MGHMSTTMTPQQEAAMQRLADAAVDMLAGMIAARVEVGMPEDEIRSSILESLKRMSAEGALR
jgi:predicted hydrolase (HD superfamily)